MGGKGIVGLFAWVVTRKACFYEGTIYGGQLPKQQRNTKSLGRKKTWEMAAGTTS